jgi:GTP-binding protein HflX
VLVHRSGQVDYVVVGDAGKLMLPDIGRLRAAEGRFRGLRLVHTHVRGEALTRDDLVDLVRLRLDLVCAIQMSPRGEARTLHYAYNTPAEAPELPYRDVGPLPIGQVDVDVAELMAGLETEFARRTRARARDVQAKDGRALLLHVGHKSRTRSASSSRAGL